MDSISVSSLKDQEHIVMIVCRGGGGSDHVEQGPAVEPLQASSIQRSLCSTRGREKPPPSDCLLGERGFFLL